MWEQELYLEMRYLVSSSWFHMFEADYSQAGLSFADEREGVNFHKKVLGKLKTYVYCITPGLLNIQCFEIFSFGFLMNHPPRAQTIYNSNFFKNL